MDPRRNPYAPGAGAPPPELAGRDALIERAAVALDRIREGRHDKSLILVGLRGVGKTVLLNRIQIDAEARGIHGVRLEAPEDRSLPGILAPSMRAALLKLDRMKAATAGGKKALRALAGFIGAMKVKFGDVEVGVDVEPEKGLADTGDLDVDLTDLLLTVGAAARERSTAFVIFVDELQYVQEDQLAALITALHRCAQSQLPITLIGAGLPQLVGRTGRAKSYAERLFDFPEIGPLDDAAARLALTAPAEKEGVAFTSKALDAILQQTKGYPYFLQEWGKHAWSVARASPIGTEHVREANMQALAELDASFFRVRFDRLTPAEKHYLRAMAELGPGPHRSGDIAEQLGRKVNSLGPARSALISKGMVYSPDHGDTAFTVPLFDQFMKRMIPTATR
ncbi:MAG TPA: ATP-binding protein [Steroidobacteraceae bacterium]|nr:ATP-binding protein [Steroidobacteraceae bacterium]